MIPYLLKKYGINKNELVVDLGAGQGHCLIPLFEQGWKNLVAVDIDDYNFKFFEEKYNITCYRVNLEIEKLPIESSKVACILSFHVIEHLKSPFVYLGEIYRVLKKGGVVFLVTPDWRKQYKTFWRDPTHYHPYDKESLGRLLRMYGFKKVEIKSWGTKLGLGKLKSYRWFKWTAFLG